MIKKTSLFLFVILLSTILSAQNIVVESFTHLETDLTANLDGTTVYDQNGEKCALIKVRSNPPTKDFIFDLGVLGVVETRYDGPDIWLYVPYGVNKITIKHPQLGVLENYDLGVSLKKATTYMLSLRVGRVQTIIEEQITKQYLQFNITPADAFLEVNGEAWTLQDGSAAELLDYGRYEYRISAKDYHEEVGVINLGSEKKTLNVDLRPAYGWIEVKGSGDLVGAKVYVDNTSVGSIPFKSDKLSSGEHTLRVVQKMYKDYIEKITVFDNQTLTINPVLKPNFANVTFSTLDGAEIWVDRKLHGTTSWTGRVEYGDHEIEVKKASHRSQKKVYTINSESKGITINLPSPVPIYGSLAVDTKPIGSSIYINGELKGETPLLLSKILIGSYEIEVRKDGKLPLKSTLTINESEMFKFQGELSDDPKVHRSETTIENKPLFDENIYKLKEKGTDLVFDVNGVQFTMKYVEGGTFTMGATAEQGSYAESDEKPAHNVTLDSYYIGETEVTQALWRAVMGSNPSNFEESKLPVESVSWNDCLEFIRKLNQITGQTFSLPTEAQWEFAARGGNLSQDYKYAGSNDLYSVAWYAVNSSGQTHPVAQKQPNELGLYDMSGNVCEWCSDGYNGSYYSSSPQHNPQGPSSSSLRVLRGGSWSSNAQYCRLANRGGDPGGTRNNYLGIRLALVSFDSSAKSSVRKDEEFSITNELKTASPKNQNELDFNVNGVQFTMKHVEGGTFLMGASDGDYSEKPAHEVKLDGYYIGETEVTQALWVAVMGSNPSASYSNARGDNKPVNNVSWNDCQDFIKKLNNLTGQTFSLPTEAQWEFAARGGNLSKGYKYAGSNTLSLVARLDDNVHPVAEKKPNELGLYDMSRNVQEWCNDWYGIDYYRSSPKINPQGPSSNPDSYRVHRGGGCYSDPSYCSVFARHRAEATSTNSCRGLRLVLNSSLKSSKQHVTNSVSNEQLVSKTKNDGTILVNETFSSSSPSWKISSEGEVAYQGGKMIFKDTKAYGYAKCIYDLPENLTNEDFELDFSMKIKFSKECSSIFFFLGPEYNKSYTFGISSRANPDKLVFTSGTYSDMYCYKDFFHTQYSPFVKHRFTMIKRGRNVEWYVDGNKLFSTNIKLNIDMTKVGFFLSNHHAIEVDYLTIKLL